MLLLSKPLLPNRLPTLNRSWLMPRKLLKTPRKPPIKRARMPPLQNDALHVQNVRPQAQLQLRLQQLAETAAR